MAKLLHPECGFYQAWTQFNQVLVDRVCQFVKYIRQVMASYTSEDKADVAVRRHAATESTTQSVLCVANKLTTEPCAANTVKLLFRLCGCLAATFL